MATTLLLTPGKAQMINYPFERKPVPVSPPLHLMVAHPEGEKTASSSRSRILDAAEQLFGKLGLTATSLHAISSDAGVNPSVIAYYFRSKNGLVEAVYERRVAPMDRLRLEMLGCCEKLHGPGQLPLQQVVEAFIAPLFKIGGCRTIIGRFHTEPGSLLPSAVVGRMNEVETRFASALKRSLPDRNSTDLRWGMIFLTGMVVRATSNFTPAATSSFAAARCDGMEDIARQMVGFACAGLRSLPSNRPELAA